MDTAFYVVERHNDNDEIVYELRCLLSMHFRLIYDTKKEAQEAADRFNKNQ